jgi:hypothetical protein
MRAVWDIAPCGLIDIDVSEVPTATINRAVMEVICTSETSVCFSGTTWCYIPEGYHLQCKDELCVLT